MSHHRVWFRTAIAFCLIGAMGMGAVHAHTGATGIVKQRMSAMKDMGAIMKVWGAIRKGKAEFQPANIRAQAETLKRHAAEMTKLFPSGSNTGVSEALSAIWDNWQAFAGIATKMEMLAAKLAGPTSTQKSSSIPLMVEIGGTCANCHKDYRKEKK